jgi:hypothetical protein
MNEQDRKKLLEYRKTLVSEIERRNSRLVKIRGFTSEEIARKPISRDAMLAIEEKKLSELKSQLQQVNKITGENK